MAVLGNFEEALFITFKNRKSIHCCFVCLFVFKTFYDFCGKDCRHLYTSCSLFFLLIFMRKIVLLHIKIFYFMLRPHWCCLWNSQKVLSERLTVFLKFWFLVFFHVPFNQSVQFAPLCSANLAIYSAHIQFFSELPSLCVRPLTVLFRSLECNSLCLPVALCPRYKIFHQNLYLTLMWKSVSLPSLVPLHCLLEMLFRIVPHPLHSTRHQVLTWSKSHYCAFPPTSKRLLLEEHHQWDEMQLFPWHQWETATEHPPGLDIFGMVGNGEVRGKKCFSRN